MNLFSSGLEDMEVNIIFFKRNHVIFFFFLQQPMQQIISYKTVLTHACRRINGSTDVSTSISQNLYVYEGKKSIYLFIRQTKDMLTF